MAQGETYEEFVAKFEQARDKPKTTDDCYTPPETYAAILGAKLLALIIWWT